RVAGPRVAREGKRGIKAVKAGNWSETPNGIVADGVELREDEIERRLVSTAPGAAGALPNSSGLVVLDTEVTPELAAEGVARDLVRVGRRGRRGGGLGVTDRTTPTVDAPAGGGAAAAAPRGGGRGGTPGHQAP